MDYDDLRLTNIRHKMACHRVFADTWHHAALAVVWCGAILCLLGVAVSKASVNVATGGSTIIIEAPSGQGVQSDGS